MTLHLLGMWWRVQPAKESCTMDVLSWLHSAPPSIFSAISQLLSLRSQHAAASVVCVTFLCVVYPLQAALTAAPSPLWSVTCCSDACFYHMLKPKGNGNSQDWALTTAYPLSGCKLHFSLNLFIIYFILHVPSGLFRYSGSSRVSRTYF